MQLEHGVVWPRELRRRLWRHQRLDVVEHGIHGGAGGGGAERPAQQIQISKFFPDFFLFVGQSGLWPVNPLKSFLSGRGTQHQFGRPFAYEHASPKDTPAKQPQSRVIQRLQSRLMLGKSPKSEKKSRRSLVTLVLLTLPFVESSAASARELFALFYQLKVDR